MPTSPAKLNAIRQLQAQLARLGRNYRIDLEALDLTSLHELQRLLRDLEDERRRAVQQARLPAWRLALAIASPPTSLLRSSVSP